MKNDNGGMRFDAGKAPMHLLPGDGLLELAKVFEYGAKKYAPRNWERGMDWSRVYDSLQRHSLAWLAGEEFDPESGLRHTAHMTWNALALMTYELRAIGVDDRKAKAPEVEMEESFDIIRRIAEGDHTVMETIAERMVPRYDVPEKSEFPKLDAIDDRYQDVRGETLPLSDVICVGSTVYHKDAVNDDIVTAKVLQMNAERTRAFIKTDKYGAEFWMNTDRLTVKQ